MATFPGRTAPYPIVWTRTARRHHGCSVKRGTDPRAYTNTATTREGGTFCTGSANSCDEDSPQAFPRRRALTAAATAAAAAAFSDATATAAGAPLHYRPCPSPTKTTLPYLLHLIYT